MKIYFNANNKATLEALNECGVKNVMLSHRYSYASIVKYYDKFDSVFMVAGTKGDPDKYHQFLKDKREYYNYATQFDVFYNMTDTMKYLKQERDMGIDWTLPVLQENFLNHLAILKPKPGDYLCLGEIKGRLELEDNIRKLPFNYKYHGLAKGKYVTNRMFESLDTSGWISAAMSKKTEVWNGNDTYSMFFGEKGRDMVPMLRHACERYKDNMEKINVKVEDVIDGDYKSLLKITFALLYMPQLKSYRFYDDNFTS
mgnify:FL=1